MTMRFPAATLSCTFCSCVCADRRFLLRLSLLVMPGLAATDAVSAIKAMQGINAVVRNAVFAFSFFGTLAFGGIATLLLIGAGSWPLALALLGTTIDGLGAFMVTLLYSVPLNEVSPPSYRPRKMPPRSGRPISNPGCSGIRCAWSCPSDAGGIHGKPRHADRTSAERSRLGVIAHAARSSFDATVESAFSR